MDSSGGTSCFSSPPQAGSADADARSQTLLADHLESLLDPSFLDRADVEIVLAAAGCGGVVPAAAVGAYSCLLARSPFFRDHISARPAGEKLRFELAELVPGGHRIGREALVSVLGYLYTARPPKIPLQECVDHSCTHQACRPAIDFVVEATYAASGFQIHELLRLFKRRLYEIVNIAFDEDILPIIIVAYECKLLDLLSHCIQNVAISNLDSMYLEKKLPDDIYRYIKEFCRQSSLLTESHTFFMDPDHESTKIHKALDSGNVDLVGMLLKQSTVTLDDAFAIHYAAAHCKPEVLKELLKLDSANVNMRNRGGYTPLHMACMRLEPDIIVSLLRKGASVPIQTRDRRESRDALTICKRLTRKEKDVNIEMKKGQETSNGYLCINILEETKWTSFLCLDQVPLEDTIIEVTPLLVPNFLMRLLDLEFRVEFAKLFFPSEAQLAMRIAEADSTEKFAATRLKEIGLKENPKIDKRLRERFDALTNTVKSGRWYFPNCSSVLDKFLDEGSALTILGSGTPEDEPRSIQLRMRFYELREDLKKAFNKDKAGGAVIVSEESSSSSPRLKMSILDTSPSRAVDGTDPTDIPDHSAAAVSGQLEFQSADVAVDDDVGVGYKRKLRSAVWDEFERVKRGNDWFAICMRCNKSLSACSKNGTKHLHRHIQTCRSRQATKVPNQSSSKLLQNPQESNITLKKYVFNQEVATKELASMICVHEYPLSMVEHAGFRKFCAAVQPMFKVVSKNTIRNYILNLYEVQKLSMVKHFEQCQARVAVTADMWTVDHPKKSYMAITAYYIDDNWKLKSYLLRFIYVPAPHTGEVISDVLQEVLTEWHITMKLSTVSIDNCTTNDNLMDKIPNKLSMGSLMLDGSLLHMCHVPRALSLIVKDGMAVMEKSIESVRKGVAFWVATTKRHESFEKTAYERNIKYEKRIALDCETRWNSTYVMLRTALVYQEVFVYLGQSEKLFTPCCPTSADWKLARELCERLKMFFDITEVLSDITYATVNIFFPKLCGIYLDIRKWQASDDPLIENMSKLLKEKFEKYWSDVYCLMAVAIVLDPRYKLHFLNAIFSRIYGEVGAAEKVAEVRKLLYTLVSQYKDSMEVVAPSTSAVQKQGNDEVLDLFDEYMSWQPVASSSYAHTELDLYLNEPKLQRTQQELDIIHWWQFEGTKYPTLQKIARDIMAISVTAVSPETVYGSGERIISSPHRSRLSPQILEAVMCVQAWSRADMLGPDSTAITSLMTCLDDDDEEGEEMELDGAYSTGVDR